MYIENKDGYIKLILNKARDEKWEITIEDGNDSRLSELFFGELPKQNKQKKKMKLESLVYIIFGRNAVESLLNEGFKTYEMYSNKKKGKQK